MLGQTRLVTLLLLTVLVFSASAQGPIDVSGSSPTVDDVLSLKRAGMPAISPDGKWVAYTVRETNWIENSWETEIWLADAASGTTRQLTNGPRGSNAPVWSPDSSRLAFASDRSGRREIYVVDPRGGEAEKLTSAEGGIRSFVWSPDGRVIAYTTVDPRSAASVELEKKYGEFEIVDQIETQRSHLHLLDLGTRHTRRLTTGAFSVGRFDWSPDSREIVFDQWLDIGGGYTNLRTTDISVVTVADGTTRPLVRQPGPDTNPVWSPDGSRIAFESKMGNPRDVANWHIATIPVSGGRIEDLTAAFDEDPAIVRWAASGIFFSASSRTWSYLFSLDPATRKVTKHAPSEKWIGTNFSLSGDARSVAFIANDPATFPDVYVAPVSTMQARKLSDLAAQVASWPKTVTDVISWRSKDGTIIEGLLQKPAGFVSGRRYPLIVDVHGGPAAVMRPAPYGVSDLWIAKGALVLAPNYRGSTGYGEKFRSLLVRNLGFGDAGDVLSGIDHLINEGLVDPDRVGVMGGSHGGYISAFLATHDGARFKAASVTSGISDWMTWYVNTDLYPRTTEYLGATPWDDPDYYAKTSPITYIKGAKAPTLIQHGATDGRVPVAGAFELYRAFQDVGVPARLILYKGWGGLGHVWTTPKSYLAVVEHNLEWFTKYLWGQ